MEGVIWLGTQKEKQDPHRLSLGPMLTDGPGTGIITDFLQLSCTKISRTPTSTASALGTRLLPTVIPDLMPAYPHKDGVSVQLLSLVMDGAEQGRE